MAAKKFIIVAGQNNALESGDAIGWEDLHPFVALRSPAHNATTQAPQFTGGAYSDSLTMSHLVPGGPSSNRLGDGDDFGSWQTSNIAGRAVQGVRYLVPYDPAPSYTNVGASSTRNYPGTCEVLATPAPTSQTITTNARWLWDPTGITLTRRKTGTAHTISMSPAWSSAADVTATVTVSPPLVPPPEVGEQFDYEIVAGANSPSDDKLVLANQFGGMQDNGSTKDAAATTGAIALGQYHSYISRVVGADGQFGAARVTLKGRPIEVGCTVNFGLPGSPGSPTAVIPTGFVAGQDYYVTRKATSSESIALTASNWDGTGGAYISMPGESLAAGESVRFQGVLPAGITENQRYYVKPLTASSVLSLTETGTMTVWAPGGSNQYGLLFNEEAAFDWVVAGYAPGDEIVITGCSNAANNGHFRILAWQQTSAPYTTARLQTVGNGIPGLVDEASTAGVTVKKVLWTTSTNLTLSTSYTSDPISWTATGGGASTIIREESGSAFYVSSTRGGAEIVTDQDSGNYAEADALRATASVSFRGSLTGLQARCISSVALSAANVGQSVPLSDVDFASYTTVSATDWNYSTVHCGSSWPAVPQAGDKFVIEPPPHKDESVPFQKLAMLLPWCPFEGRASYRGPATVSMSGAVSEELYVTVANADLVLPVIGSVVQLHTTGYLSTPLQVGSSYYVQRVVASSATVSKIYLKAAYADTSAIVADGIVTQSGTHSITVWDQQSKVNPYPPGFNYPNHYGTPRPYQPFEGPSLIGMNPRMGISTGLALKLHEYLGETMNVAVCAVDRTSVGHKEILEDITGESAYSWMDPTQQKSWGPGETNNCFARFEDVLDSLKMAFEADGDTGECVGVFFVQGEEDAVYESFAANYELSGTRLKTAIREAIKSRSMFTGPANQIPFVWPKIKTVPWEYATQVNAAIDAIVNADAYCRTYSVDDVALMPGDSGEGSDKIGPDYSGAGQSKAVDLAYASWQSIQRSGTTKLDVCRLALSNIGDTATVTSVDPPDDSLQARLCAQYWTLALNKALQRHDWDFSIRRVSPTAMTTDRTEWLYSYALPSDFVGVVAVLPKDTTDDSNYNGMRVKLKYALETDTNHVRRLYCNEQNVVLRYNALVYDLAQWTDSAIIALGWMLSSMLAPPLMKGAAGMEAARHAIQMFDYQLQQAAGFDSGTTREKFSEDNVASWDQRWGDSQPWSRYL